MSLPCVALHMLPQRLFAGLHVHLHPPCCHVHWLHAWHGACCRSWSRQTSRCPHLGPGWSHSVTALCLDGDSTFCVVSHT